MSNFWLPPPLYNWLDFVDLEKCPARTVQMLSGKFFVDHSFIGSDIKLDAASALLMAAPVVVC
jgi:hypothetical protein